MSGLYYDRGAAFSRLAHSLIVSDRASVQAIRALRVQVGQYARRTRSALGPARAREFLAYVAWIGYPSLLVSDRQVQS